MMEQKLRHSHIAIRVPFQMIAELLGLNVGSGQDDMGEFRFGDIALLDENNKPIQKFRFASHEFDSMTHLLAENIDAERQLAFVLYIAGIRSGSEISISKDQNGKEVRSSLSLLASIQKLVLDEAMDYEQEPEPLQIHYHF